MTHTHRSWALPALALTFVLAACSTPEDLTAPTLEPQFGSADDDIASYVAFNSAGSLYVGSTRDYQYEVNDGDGSYPYLVNGAEVNVQRYDRSGNFVWSKTVFDYTCPEEADCGFDLYLNGTETDANSNVYVLTAFPHTSGDLPRESNSLYKYDKNGNFLWSKNVGHAPSGSLAVDGAGNAYVARKDDGGGYNENGEDEYYFGNRISKYSTSGTLVWERTPTVGDVKDITVSSSGSVYIVGTTGMSRYSSTGAHTWTKPGNFEEIVVSGSNLYTRYRKDIRKYDGTGKQLWLKSQTGLNTMIFQDMTGDGSGNIYLSGKYQVSTSNYSPMVRKLNSSGTVLWTKTYGTTAYDDARGIATVDGSEIYVAGETQGSLAHPNIGGRDSYLRKLSSSGTHIWTR